MCPFPESQSNLGFHESSIPLTRAAVVSSMAKSSTGMAHPTPLSDRELDGSKGALAYKPRSVSATDFHSAPHATWYSGYEKQATEPGALEWIATLWLREGGLRMR